MILMPIMYVRSMQRSQPFGRSMVVSDPDGLRIQINEHDATKYDDGHKLVVPGSAEGTE